MYDCCKIYKYISEHEVMTDIKIAGWIVLLYFTGILQCFEVKIVCNINVIKKWNTLEKLVKSVAISTVFNVVGILVYLLCLVWSYTHCLYGEASVTYYPFHGLVFLPDNGWIRQAKPIAKLNKNQYKIHIFLFCEDE